MVAARCSPGAPVVALVFALGGCTLPLSPGWQAEYFRPSARVYFDIGQDDDGEVDVFQDGSLNPAVDFLAVTYDALVKETSAFRGTDEAFQEMEEKLADAKEDLKTAKASSDGTLPPSVQSRIEAIDSEVQRLRLARADAIAKQTARDVKHHQGSRLNGDWIVGPRLAVGITSPARDAEVGDETASGAPVLFVSGSLFADFYKQAETADAEAEVGIRFEAGWMRGISADENLDDADDDALFVGLSVFL